MIKFFKNLIIFLLLFLLIFSFIIRLQFSWYYNSYGMINLNYNTYLLGDSRAHSIKDKLEFIGIHNFSKPSDSFHDILNKIRYLTKKTNLNQIILDVGSINYLIIV